MYRQRLQGIQMHLSFQFELFSSLTRLDPCQSFPHQANSLVIMHAWVFKTFRLHY